MPASPDTQLPPFIGPHEDRELELLLAGTKPLARLSTEPDFAPDLTLFAPHVAAGTIIQVDVTRHVTNRHGQTVPLIIHYFCLPTEEWRIKLMEVMHEVMSRPDKGGFTLADLNRLDGHLLGYSKADIEAFITHTSD